MKARRFIVEAKSRADAPCLVMHSDWSTGDWICVETSLTVASAFLLLSQEIVMGGGVGSRLGTATFPESRWANIPRGPTHQGNRRRALPAEVSLDISPQLSSLKAPQHKRP